MSISICNITVLSIYITVFVPPLIGTNREGCPLSAKGNQFCKKKFEVYIYIHSIFFIILYIILICRILFKCSLLTVKLS